jgi:hypothetical protein
LQADPEDSITRRTRLDPGKNLIFLTAPIPEEEKAKCRILPRSPFKSFDKSMVAFQCRKSRHFSDPETVGIEAESLPVSGAFAFREGVKTLSIDSIAQGELAAMHKAQRLKLFKLLS